MNINSISQEFAILPGVLGSSISSHNQGILFSDFPAFFTAPMIEEAAQNINKMIQMAETQGLAPQTLTIRYDKFDIVAMPVDNHAILLILCEPGNNTSLVSTTACMLSPELEKLFNQPNQQADKKPPPQNKQEAAQTDSIDPKTAQALRTIKQALFDSLGPIAEMVFNESLKRWTANAPPGTARIAELVGYIAEDINNPAIFEEFKGKITALL